MLQIVKVYSRVVAYQASGCGVLKMRLERLSFAATAKFPSLAIVGAYSERRRASRAQ